MLLVDEFQFPQVVCVAQGMGAIGVAEIRFPMIVHRPPGKPRKNPGGLHGGRAAPGMNRIVGQSRRGRHMQPMQLPPDPQPRLIHVQHRRVAQVRRLNRRRRRGRYRHRALPTGFHQGGFGDPVTQHILENLGGAFDRHEMLGLGNTSPRS